MDAKESELTFSEWVASKKHDLDKVGEGYDKLPSSSKKCIDYAIIRYNKYLQNLKLKNNVIK